MYLDRGIEHVRGPQLNNNIMLTIANVNQDIDAILKQDKSEGGMAPLGPIVATPAAVIASCSTWQIYIRNMNTLQAGTDQFRLLYQLYSSTYIDLYLNKRVVHIVIIYYYLKLLTFFNIIKMKFVGVPTPISVSLILNDVLIQAGVVHVVFHTLQLQSISYCGSGRPFHR